ncbi:MAG: penicillin-binding transpeptidase domain-containing protein [Anaerolineales bacterium]
MKSSAALKNMVATWRIILFGGILIVIFLIYIGRLYNLQVIQYSDWLAKSNENRTHEINLPSTRGMIYDRYGYILARNIPSYNVVITPAFLPDDEGEVQKIYRALSDLAGIPVNRGEVSTENPYVPCISDHGITQIVIYGETTAPYEPVKIACDVKQQVALAIQENETNWPGVGIDVVPVRDYPTGSLTASIIGFLGPIPAIEEDYYRAMGFVPNRDKVGYAGVELYFQNLLAGENGHRVVEWDIAGQILDDLVPLVSSTPGSSIVLTIDTRFQQAVQSILIDEINDWNKSFGEERYTSGAVIAMNPRTGEILAIVNYPTYENNRMARIIPAYYYEQLISDKRNPLLNLAVGTELPAGSVFKLVTATGGLNEGVVTPDEIIKTPGKITVTERYYANDPGRPRDFVDWIYRTRPEGFGQLDFVHAIANSSNVYFYKVGGGYQDEVNPGLGICRLGTYARALGYGTLPDGYASLPSGYKTPEIELPDVASGLIPDPDWKRINQGESWSTGDTYISSVGQGYDLASPLQVLLSAATVANGGKLMAPTLLYEVLDSEGNIIQPFMPHLRWDLTVDPVIQVYEDNTIRGCQLTGEMKTVQPWVFDEIRTGMRLAVIEGTLKSEFTNVNIAAAGKTGTAEYCDEFAKAKNLCEPGNWPSHAWTVAFAPYEDPEIAVVAFVYNGQEGSTVAGPIVRRVLEAYFELKSADSAVNP